MLKCNQLLQPKIIKHHQQYISPHSKHRNQINGCHGNLQPPWKTTSCWSWHLLPWDSTATWQELEASTTSLWAILGQVITDMTMPTMTTAIQQTPSTTRPQMTPMTITMTQDPLDCKPQQGHRQSPCTTLADTNNLQQEQSIINNNSKLPAMTMTQMLMMMPMAAPPSMMTMIDWHLEQLDNFEQNIMQPYQTATQALITITYYTTVTPLPVTSTICPTITPMLPTATQPCHALSPTRIPTAPPYNATLPHKHPPAYGLATYHLPIAH